MCGKSLLASGVVDSIIWIPGSAISLRTNVVCPFIVGSSCSWCLLNRALSLHSNRVHGWLIGENLSSTGLATTFLYQQGHVHGRFHVMCSCLSVTEACRGSRALRCSRVPASSRLWHVPLQAGPVENTGGLSFAHVVSPEDSQEDSGSWHLSDLAQSFADALVWSRMVVPFSPHASLVRSVDPTVFSVRVDGWNRFHPIRATAARCRPAAARKRGDVGNAQRSTAGRCRSKSSSSCRTRTRRRRMSRCDALQGTAVYMHTNCSWGWNKLNLAQCQMRVLSIFHLKDLKEPQP